MSSKSARKIRELEEKVSMLKQIVLQQAKRIKELEEIVQVKTRNEEKLQETIKDLKERVNKIPTTVPSRPPQTHRKSPSQRV